MRTEFGVDTIELTHEVGPHLRRHGSELGNYLRQVLQEPIYSLGGRVLLSISAHCPSLPYISIPEIYHAPWELSSVLDRRDFAMLVPGLCFGPT
jgi:hypothetical protein